MAMEFTSSVKVDFPNEDILTYVFGNTLFQEDDPIWFNAANIKEYLTLRQARSLTGRIGSYLRNLGVGANRRGKDFVLCFVENQTLVGPTCFGVLCAGGVHSACPMSSTVAEAARQIGLSKPKVMICSELTKSTAQKALQQAGMSKSVHLLVMDSSSCDIKSTINGSSLPHEELIWERITDPTVLDSTTALTLFSSGTTGIPKGVQLTHRNIVSNLVQMRHIFDRVATPQQKATKRLRMPGIIQNSAPAGILVHSMMALQRGMQVFLVTKYNFDELVHMIREYELSALFLVPAVYLRITQTFRTEDLRNIRWALSGASPLSPDLQSKVNAMLPAGVNLNVNWGMTETTCGATQLEPNEQESEGSVGRLLPGMKLAILGADGKHQGPGQLGEVCLKGPNIMRSYFENPQATKAAHGNDGWFLTGDIGMMSASGKLFIKGRAKELMKYKGNQVSPTELEAVIGECPGVADVGVIGIPDGEGNDLPRAYVVRSESNSCTVSGVHEFVNKRVSRYKQLRGGVVFIAEIPRNTNGKIMRDVLKKRASAELGGETSQPKL